MEIELAYKKLLLEHNLTVDQLPADARVGIKSIDEILAAVRLIESKGKYPKQGVFDKIRANDKWIVREILDFVEETDKNKGDLPNDSKSVVADIKDGDPKLVDDPTAKAGDDTKKDDTPADDKKADEPAAATSPDPKGVKVDEELKALIEAGKTKLTLEEVKSAAPTTYGVLFDAYTPGADNGIVTDKFQIIETEKEVFTVSKI